MDYYLSDMERQELQKAFGSRVKTLRKQKGWTQKELAAKADVRSAQLNKYEGGLHSPPFETLLKLAEALDTSIDYLVAGDESEEIPLHSQRLLERFRELQDFDADDQDTVIKLIDALIVQRKLQGVVQAAR